MVNTEVFDAIVIQEQSQRASFPEPSTCYLGDQYLNELVNSKADIQSGLPDANMAL